MIAPRDPDHLPLADSFWQSAWYSLLFYSLTLTLTKISILLLYINIFTYQWIRRCSQIILGIVVLTGVYMLVIICTACIPLAAYWDTTITNKYCHPEIVWWINTGVLILGDFLIFLVPMPAVWTLRLPRRQKLTLLGVFGLGFL